MGDAVEAIYPMGCRRHFCCVADVCFFLCLHVWRPSSRSQFAVAKLWKSFLDGFLSADQSPVLHLWLHLKREEA